MYTISSKVYLEVAERLSALIGSLNYYSGWFEFESDELSCRMVLSIFIHRHKETLPEGRVVDVIDNIIPVWWEFHTYVDGEEVLNNFSFNELREFI